MKRDANDAIDYEEWSAQPVSLAENGIETANHRRKTRQRTSFSKMTCGNNQEEIRRETDSQCARHTQPWIDAKAEKHQEETKEIGEDNAGGFHIACETKMRNRLECLTPFHTGGTAGNLIGRHTREH